MMTGSNQRLSFGEAQNWMRAENRNHPFNLDTRLREKALGLPSDGDAPNSRASWIDGFRRLR
jgi:hypothetical protein